MVNIVLKKIIISTRIQQVSSINSFDFSGENILTKPDVLSLFLGTFFRHKFADDLYCNIEEA